MIPFQKIALVCEIGGTWLTLTKNLMLVYANNSCLHKTASIFRSILNFQCLCRIKRLKKKVQFQKEECCKAQFPNEDCRKKQFQNEHRQKANLQNLHRQKAKLQNLHRQKALSSPANSEAT